MEYLHGPRRVGDENGNTVGYCHSQRGSAPRREVSVGFTAPEPAIPVTLMGEDVISMDLAPGRETRRHLIELAAKVCPPAHHVDDRLLPHHAEGADLARRGEGCDSQIGELGDVLRIVDDRH
jgi:hypothetical protein